MHVVVYTDASHATQDKIAACGFFILINGNPRIHEVVLAEIDKSHEAETYAVVLGLTWVKEHIKVPIFKLIVKSDHQNIKLGSKKRKQFKNLVPLIEYFKEKGSCPIFEYVKGHSGNKYNSLVDKNARFHLRKYLKQNTK